LSASLQEGSKHLKINAEKSLLNKATLQQLVGQNA
jgi:hypothetical protein